MAQYESSLNLSTDIIINIHYITIHIKVRL